VVEPSAVIAWLKRQNPAPELRIFPGVGHFFHGHLTELRDAVIETLRSG
jgi:alpha/beta superfamily hydrolase